MFKKLKVKIKKEEPKYELPNRPMDEWTLKEIKEICTFYGKNHEKCPFYMHDMYGKCCEIRGMLSWDCKFNPP